MPFAETQQDGLDEQTQLTNVLLVSLSGNIHSSWANAWDDVCAIPEHQRLINFFLWILQRCIDSHIIPILEVIEAPLLPRLPSTRIVTYHRLWIPLTQQTEDAFIHHCNSALLTVDPMDGSQKLPVRGCRFVETNLPVVSSGNIADMATMEAVLSLYCGGVCTEDLSSMEMGDRIVYLMNYERGFARHYKNVPGGCHGDITNYVFPDKNNLLKLKFAPDIVAAGAVRMLYAGRGKIIQRADDLCRYMLPIFRVPRERLLEKIRLTAHSSGIAMPDDVTSDTIVSQLKTAYMDPIYYSPIEFNDDDDERYSIHTVTTRLNRILNQVYPIISRVYSKNSEYVGKSETIDELRIVWTSAAKETDSLYGSRIVGVPWQYATAKHEADDRLRYIRQAPDEVEFSMFYKSRSGNMTRLATTLAEVVLGTMVTMAHTPRQRLLTLFGYTRHFMVLWNKTGAHGIIYVTGPSDAGKSKACEDMISMIATCMQRTNDGQSDKLHTIFDPSNDLVIEYEDEAKHLNHHASTNPDTVKAKQTRASNGVMATSRVRLNPVTNTYAAEHTNCSARIMMFICTNMPHLLTAAMQSRSEIFTVSSDDVVTQMGRANAMVLHDPVKAAQRNTFIFVMQTISALQSAYWMRQAQGLLSPIDTTALTAFLMIADTKKNMPKLAPRRIDAIRNMCIAMLVQELTTLWYRTMVGKREGYRDVTFIEFISRRNFITTEHVISSVAIMTNSTQATCLRRDVDEALKRKITVRDNNPILSPDEHYYILDTNARNFEQDITLMTPTHGGNTTAMLKTIRGGMSNGMLNIVFDRLTDTVRLNKYYISEVSSADERTVLLALAQGPLKSKLQHWHSYDEHYYVFSNMVKTNLFDSANIESAAAMFPGIEQLTVSQLALALALLRNRVVYSDSKAIPLWIESTTTVDIAVVHSERVATSVPMKTEKDCYKTRKCQNQALMVHKTLFASLDTIPISVSVLSPIYADFARVGGIPVNRELFVGVSEAVSAPMPSTILTVAEGPALSLTCANPFYRPCDDSALFGESISKRIKTSDAFFPPHHRTFTFTDSTNLDQTICNLHNARYLNSPCPEKWWPLNTSYV